MIASGESRNNRRSHWHWPRDNALLAQAMLEAYLLLLAGTSSPATHDQLGAFIASPPDFGSCHRRKMDR